MTLHFLHDVVNDIEYTQKSINTSLSLVGTVNQLVNCSRLLISSLPGLALRTHVESLGWPRDVNKCSQSLAW